MYEEDRGDALRMVPPASGHTEHHHSLLPGIGRFGGVPSSAAHLADQMESGGAKIEETLSRLNCRYQSLFFVASWGIILAALLSLTNAIMRLKVASVANSMFLLAFGFVMSVLDIPGSPRWAARYRLLVRKYVRFLTRITGKSFWFLYLGSIIAVSLWPASQSNRGRGMMLIFTAVSTSVLVLTVAILGLFIAFRKSLRLERVRKSLMILYKGNSPEVYRKYAITDPSHGMQFEEFNRLCTDHSQGKVLFDISDLGIIYNALDEHQKSAINEREFSEWMAGPMTYL